MKIKNDKYYTPEWLVKYTIEKTKEVIGEENITQFLEPSAGDGRFLDLLPPDTLAYDLYPERDDIIKKDYLRLEIGYKEGRCVIGNPPFGGKSHLYKNFSDKSFKIGDYLVFILPVSQLDNNYFIYKFDLIYSENLGEVLFSDTHKIPVCLNIYKRPENGKLNKRKNIYTDEDVMDMALISNHVSDNHALKKQELKLKKFGDYDLCIIGWGRGLGNITEPFKHANAKIIKIKDKENYDFIYNTIVNSDWYNIINAKGKSTTLSIWHIYKHVLTEMYKAGLYDKDKKFLKNIERNSDNN